LVLFLKIKSHRTNPGTKMKNVFSKKLIDRTFEIGVLIKSMFGIFEILAGIFFATPGRLITNNLILSLTQQEISEDPKDFFANYLIKAANVLSPGINFFAVVYLIFHGVVNIFLAIFLLKNKIWAYPWAIIGFSLFIIYQIYRYYHTHSQLLMILTVFDIFIVLIVFVEYKRKSKQRTANVR